MEPRSATSAFPRNASNQTDRPPRVGRRSGNSVLWWPVDEGCLGSRSIGKVNIDCRLRFSESRWGVLGDSRPAGILYVDLTFDQPRHCKLSSATVLISLEEDDETADETGGATEHNNVSLGRLRMCDFGPRLLTGEPTTLDSKTEWSFTPEANVGIGTVGGIGVRREKAISHVSFWVLKGNMLTAVDKRRKTSGIVYRTLKWELTENELAWQPMDKSVVHTGFAFEHGLKRFHIKVEIRGKVRGVAGKLRGVFPPKLKRHQGISFTVVEPGSESDARKESLDSMAQTLEARMRDRNLVANPTKSPRAGATTEDKTELPDDPAEAQRPSPPGDIPEGGEDGMSSDLAALASATVRFPASTDTNTSPLSTCSTAHSSTTAVDELGPEPSRTPVAPTDILDDTVEKTRVWNGHTGDPDVVPLAKILLLLRMWAYATFLNAFLPSKQRGLA
ncbi:hypothetical protein O9K51_05629 [Purpureocillium lavendulum]|uniref:Uncharacterized protein n=1 Tax=Purpureocillium lavendulum TaxID=1247861 RepID=A0AB34FRY2_9HYPO|nr:hypothetical protein O9K51_05629 [Purpureocillium lavendulum]